MHLDIVIIHYTYFYHYPGLCGGLSDPANGQATLAGRTSGSTATYTCNNGYQLMGRQTRTCQNTGMWSGMAPTCTRKKNSRMIAIIVCLWYQCGENVTPKSIGLNVGKNVVLIVYLLSRTV